MQFTSLVLACANKPERAVKQDQNDLKLLDELSAA